MTFNNRKLIKKIIVLQEVKVASTFHDKLFGLLYQPNPKLMLFHTRFGIHTFLMKKPLDVVVLSNKRQVTSYKENLQPNRIFLWNPKFPYVLEMPAGSIQKLNINLGDTINFPTSPKRSG